jgi:hypothetical protein
MAACFMRRFLACRSTSLASSSSLSSPSRSRFTVSCVEKAFSKVSNAGAF